MPLNPQSISSGFKPIFKKWSKKAMLKMHTAPFSEYLSLVEMQQGTAQVFALEFSNMAQEFVSELQKTVASGLVSTSNGSAPPLPIDVGLAVQGFQQVFFQGAYLAFLGMHTIAFDSTEPQTTMQSKTVKGFGNLFSNMSIQFGAQMVATLTAWTSLVPTAIASDFRSVFKNGGESAMSALFTTPFSEDLPQSDMQSMTATQFGTSFSDMSTPFATMLVKTLKSSPVTCALGVGNIS